MDISLNSSAILVIIVGLWLVWVVPFFLRRRDGMPAHQLALGRNLPAVTSPSQTEDSSSQGNILENTSKPASSGSAPSTSAARSEAAQSLHPTGQSGPAPGPGRAPGPLRIRYGRTALAGFGAAALLVGVVGAIISFAGLIPAYIPVVSLLAAVGSVAALRALAVRDRTKRSEQRVEAAFREAMNPDTAARRDGPDAPHSGRTPEGSPAPGRPGVQAPKRETKLFDAENPAHDGTDGEEAAPAGQEGPQAETTDAATTPGQQLTADDLRQAALAVAAESDNQDNQAGETNQANETGESTQTWEPVHVPKPKYVESAKADRPAPEPLELPAEPKPEGKPSIKAGAVAPKVEMKLDQEAVEQTAHKGQPVTTAAGTDDGAAPQSPAGQAKLPGGLHDLDNVLQRRRA